MEFRIDDYLYRQTARINGFDQLDILAKIGPLLSSGVGELAPILIDMKANGITNLLEGSLKKLGDITTPVAREFAKMSSADRKYILGTCLATVERKRDGEVGWAKIWNADAGRAMYDDINYDFLLMLRIALGVFQETFARFLPASLSALIGASPESAHSIQ